MERIHIQTQFQPGETGRNGQLTLLHDPANPHGYFIVHAEGVHAVQVPWLGRLEIFVKSDSKGLLDNMVLCVWVWWVCDYVGAIVTFHSFPFDKELGPYIMSSVSIEV